LPGCGHAERALQVSWWQEHGAAHAGGARAQQAGKLETRALFAGSQGGTVAPAGSNTCAPRAVRLDLRSDMDRTGPPVSPDRPHRSQWQGRDQADWSKRVDVAVGGGSGVSHKLYEKTPRKGLAENPRQRPILDAQFPVLKID